MRWCIAYFLVMLLVGAACARGCDSEEKCEARGGTWESHLKVVPCGKTICLIPVSSCDERAMP